MTTAIPNMPLPLSAPSKFHRYLRRVPHFRHMDFEYALWQALHLFIAPQRVFQLHKSRSYTKAQFARDDPAFLVLVTGVLCLTSVVLALPLNIGFLQTLGLMLYVIGVDFLLTALIVATICWMFVNRSCEWGYAFDVHLNAFFPPLVLLHCLQPILYKHFISQDWVMSRILGNAIWLAAVCYYIYITFLGYNCLGHLKRVRFILTALPIAALFYIITVIVGWNLTVTLMTYYRYRVM